MTVRPQAVRGARNGQKVTAPAGRIRARSAAVLTIAAAAAVLFSLVLVSCGPTATAGGSLPAAARLAPDFSGVTLDGVQVSLSEYRGKPLVLTFMATW